MKKTVVSTLLSMVTTTLVAQTTEPVVMTVAGKPVTRSEFEYAYNKNASIAGAVEKKTVAEYAQMYLDYKLKVAAAEAAHLDTLQSFRTEFMQYRDMQLTPFMVDQAYIDSIAHQVWQATADQLKGKDMLRTAHILVMVRQGSSEAQYRQGRHKMDSIMTLLNNGADFAEVARTTSDDRGTAARGGELPWIGPGMTLQPYEDAAYALQAGQMSGVVKTDVGFHIIKMLERKQLAPFDSLRDEIYTALRQQGVENRSAEERIRRMVEASKGRLTREAVLDSVMQAATANDSNLKHLIGEYHDGLLFYEMCNRTVWGPAEADTVGLERQFADNKARYTWDEPRYRGYLVTAKNKKALKAALKVLKKNVKGDWRRALRAEVNKDSIVARVSGPMLVKKGENLRVDALAFKGEQPKNTHGYPYAKLYGKTLKAPAVYTDVRSQVLSDVRTREEQKWVEQLRQTIPYQLFPEVLATVKEQ